jgi:co-chaperonin GroES (HSP10)
MKLVPLHDRVIFRFLELDERSTQGIILLSGQQAEARGGVQFGVVESVGPDCKVAVAGDVIMLGPGSTYTELKAPRTVTVTDGRIVVETDADMAMTDEGMIYAVLKDDEINHEENDD